MNRVRTSAALIAAVLLSGVRMSSAAEEAPAGFDDGTNGYLSPSEFRKAREVFDHDVTIEEGLGPVYTARSCASCHGQPRSGGGSQVVHLQVGHADPVLGFAGAMAELGDGSPISLVPFSGFLFPRAICGDAQMTLVETGTAEPIRSGRIALSALGDGFVEAIADATILFIAAAQPGQSGGAIAGEPVFAPVFEAQPIAVNVGRFGWKSLSGSLLSFAAGAYLGDLGLTSRVFPVDAIGTCDTVRDPEDDPRLPVGKQGIDVVAGFLRSTKAPPRNAILAATPEAVAGEVVFSTIGCNICHTPTIVTAPPGTLNNGGTFPVPPALGDKIIHPYSDFLLHDVGTGDGTVMLGFPVSTANKLRTSPLWGLRMRNRLMHDGRSNTLTEAIERHRGEAAGASDAFQSLGSGDRANLIRFLHSL